MWFLNGISKVLIDFYQVIWFFRQSSGQKYSQHGKEAKSGLSI